MAWKLIRLVRTSPAAGASRRPTSLSLEFLELLAYSIRLSETQAINQIESPFSPFIPLMLLIGAEHELREIHRSAGRPCTDVSRTLSEVIEKPLRHQARHAGQSIAGKLQRSDNLIGAARERSTADECFDQIVVSAQSTVLECPETTRRSLPHSVVFVIEQDCQVSFAPVAIR